MNYRLALLLKTKKLTSTIFFSGKSSPSATLDAEDLTDWELKNGPMPDRPLGIFLYFTSPPWIVVLTAHAPHRYWVTQKTTNPLIARPLSGGPNCVCIEVNLFMGQDIPPTAAEGTILNISCMVRFGQTRKCWD